MPLNDGVLSLVPILSGVINWGKLRIAKGISPTESDVEFLVRLHSKSLRRDSHYEERCASLRAAVVEEVAFIKKQLEKESDDAER